MEWIASAAFGLEGLVRRDLERLGAQRIEPLPTGGVRFFGDAAAGFSANLWLRTCERVSLVMGSFEARSFEELFQGVRGIRWAEFLPKDAAFPVRAQCARSQLMSPSDCQSIAKKAIVEALRSAHKITDLHETGATFQVDVSIHNDLVTVSLDSSGAALSRRGYRTWNGEAPLRETLAAAVVLSSPWRASQPLYDPCCGTGTLLIEAALIATDRAPGLNREFACEAWPFMNKHEMQALREEARARFEKGRQRPVRIAGSDIDPDALELCKRHLQQAGIGGLIQVTHKDLRDVSLTGGPGAMLVNPPYGERMGDKKAAAAVARQLGVLMKRSPGYALGAITADRGFERALGRRADKRRRFYNGRLECELMIFNP